MMTQCLTAGLSLTMICSPSTARGGGNPACGAAARHDCLNTGGPGCTDETCCNEVCAFDSFCCNLAWDGICVSEASANCDSGVGPCDNPANHPCDVTGGPGCSDNDCCTTVCALDSFCCQVAWDDICVNEASSFCGPCFACVRCPPGTRHEGEPCGSDLNGGCNSTPPAFGTIQLGESVCGTMWTNASQHDTDAYQFVVRSDNTHVYWGVFALYPSSAFILNDDCGNVQIIATGYGNGPVQAEALLNAGTYVAVTGQLFGTNPCGNRNNQYYAYLDGYVACLGDIYFDNIVNMSDLLFVINDWGCAKPVCRSEADVNVDGIVNAGDLLMVINNWGPCP